MKSKNKKQTSIKIAIIAGIVLFSLIIPSMVSAGIADIVNANPQFKLLQGAIKLFLKGTGMTPMAIAESFLVKISEFVFYLLNLLVKLSATVFDGMLNIGFKSHLDVVKAGWEVTRDFSNMLFILFLVIIAFGTILRTEKYGIKQLLPKIIIIALLINFSLVICSVIIDFSNLTANFFIDDIKRYTSKEGVSTNTGKEGISATLIDSLRLAEIYKPIECNKLSDEPKQEGEKSAQDECIEDAIGKFGDNLVAFVISMTMGSLVMLVAVFTFLAGAILLLIRVVVIWFLVMLVPLVFICYIMPALRQNWQKWWKTFLQWCFFAPAYAFFIWLAVKVAVEGGTLIVAKKMSTEFTGMGAIVNAFTSSPALIIHYLFIIALLLGGLVVASKFGIYGADTAMKVGQKWYKGAGTWAKRTGMRPVKVAGTAVGAGTLTAGGALFGGKIGRRMQARAVQLRQVAEERPEHKKYAALLKRMSPHDKLEEMETKGIRGFMATKEVASDPKLVRTINAQKAGLVMDKLRKFGEHQAADKLEEVRGDAIKDKTEQEKVVQKVTQEGNLNKIPAIAFKDERLVAAINKFASAPQIESLGKVSPQHAKNLKDTLGTLTTAGNAILAGMSALDKEKIHHSYASQSGEISRMSTAQKINWAKKTGPEGLKRMTTFDADIAVNIPTAQLKNTLEKMFNATVAKDIVAHLKATPGAAAHDLATNDPYISNLG